MQITFTNKHLGGFRLLTNGDRKQSESHEMLHCFVMQLARLSCCPVKDR